MKQEEFCALTLNFLQNIFQSEVTTAMSGIAANIYSWAAQEGLKERSPVPSSRVKNDLTVVQHTLICECQHCRALHVAQHPQIPDGKGFSAPGAVPALWWRSSSLALSLAPSPNVSWHLLPPPCVASQCTRALKTFSVCILCVTLWSTAPVLAECIQWSAYNVLLFTLKCVNKSSLTLLHYKGQLLHFSQAMLHVCLILFVFQVRQMKPNFE